MKEKTKKEMISLYKEGYSTAEVAKKIKVNQSTVCRNLRSLGLTRTLSESGFLRYERIGVSNEYFATHHRARRIFSKHYGPIPIGLCIHHIDGDHTNNSIDNLSLLTRSNHARVHGKYKKKEVLPLQLWLPLIWIKYD
jgi:hypothetical protein